MWKARFYLFFYQDVDLIWAFNLSSSNRPINYSHLEDLACLMSFSIELGSRVFITIENKLFIY